MPQDHGFEVTLDFKQEHMIDAPDVMASFGREEVDAVEHERRRRAVMLACGDNIMDLTDFPLDKAPHYITDTTPCPCSSKLLPARVRRRLHGRLRVVPQLFRRKRHQGRSQRFLPLAAAR